MALGAVKKTPPRAVHERFCGFVPLVGFQTFLKLETPPPKKIIPNRVGAALLIDSRYLTTKLLSKVGTQKPGPGRPPAC